MPPRKLLTLGHSYIVGMNRQFAYEMAIAGQGQWDVTVVAPQSLPTESGRIRLERTPEDQCRIVPAPIRWTAKPHIMAYGHTVRDLIRGGSWDMIHLWAEPYTYSAYQVARWSRGTPLVFGTLQNLDKRYPPPFRWFETTVLESSVGWIAGGQTTQETLSRKLPGYRTTPHRLITLGVDIKRFRPQPSVGRMIRKSLGWSLDGPPVVGFVGRLVEEKGIRFLMDVLDRLSCGWRALIVGRGPLERVVRQWAGRREAAVRIVTDASHHQVPWYLNAMDVLAAPSLTTPKWREQLGRMVIEAMACGVSVLGSSSGEIPYVIAKSGGVAEEGNLEAWAAAMGTLLTNPSLRREWAQKGVDRVRESFSWSHVARQHLDFFEECLGRPKTQRGTGQFTRL